MSDPIEITFNPDRMMACDLKSCVEVLETIFDQFDKHSTKLPTGSKYPPNYDWTSEQAEEFMLRVLQYRNNFTTVRERKLKGID